MKKISIKVIMLALITALLLVLGTASAMADETVLTGGTVKASEIPDGNKISFSGVTVTLDMDVDRTIKGITASDGGSLNITGSGKLTLSGGCIIRGDLNIASGTTVYMNTHNEGGYDFTVDGTATTSGDLTIDSYRYAFTCYSTLTINGGNISINTSNGSAALYGKTLNINGGTIDLTSSVAEEYGPSYIIQGQEALNIAEGLKILIPENGKVQGKTIVDKDGNLVKKVRIAPPPAYTLKGVTAAFTGASYHDYGSLGQWWGPDGDCVVPLWEGSAPPEESIISTSMRFYTDSDYMNMHSQTTEPQPGDVCYSFVSVFNADTDDHSVDYTKVTTTNVAITIPGYTVAVTGIVPEKINDKDGVHIQYTATKDASITTYAIAVTGGTAHADVSGSVGSVITKAAEGDTVWLVGDDSAIPEGQYIYGWTSDDVSISGGYNHFTMPAKTVSISPVYKDRVKRTYDLSGGATEHLSDSDTDSLLFLVDESLVDADQPDFTAWDLYHVPVKLDLDKNGTYDISFGYDDGWVYKVLTETNSVTENKTFTFTRPGTWLKCVTFQFAAPSAYPIWVGSTQVTSANKDDILGDGGKAKFNPSTYTLTLNNPTITGSHNNGVICFNPLSDDPTELKITGSATIEDSSTSAAILGIESTIELNGTFTLSGKKWGIGAFYVTVSGGTVNATGGDSGISAEKTVTISGGKVTATGSEDSTGDRAGIYAKSVIISNATVSAKGRVNGICANADISISGTKVEAETWVENESQAIKAGGDITISGGTVTTKTAATGIRAAGKIDIKNGTQKVEADAKKHAVWADSSLQIGDELMIKKPEGGINDGKNIYESDESTEAIYALIVPKETLPKVIGVKAHVAGTELSGGKYSVNTDVLEAVFESSTAPVKLSTSYLYTEQACANALTTEPQKDTTYYFIIAMDAYTDGDPATVEWETADKFINSGSDLTADNAEVSIVELAHSPAGGSLSVICKYTLKDSGFSSTTYIFTKGGGGEWIKGSATGLEFTVKGSPDDSDTFTNFTGVQVDGVALDTGKYTASAGSVNIELKKEYLETLSNGSHTITAVFTNGSGKASFTVKAGETPPEPTTSVPTPTPRPVPKTGDSNHPVLWYGLVLLGAAGLAMLAVLKTSRKKK